MLEVGTTSECTRALCAAQGVYELMPEGLRALIVVKQHLLRCIVKTILRRALLVIVNFCHTRSLIGYGPARGSSDQRTAADALRAYTLVGDHRLPDALRRAS